MSTWQFPPRDPAEDPFDLARALETETLPPVHNQHVVSRGVLRGFASPARAGTGAQLIPYDVTRRHMGRPRGLKGCAKIDNFVKFASGSVEQLWKETEDKVGPVIGKAGSDPSTLSDSDRALPKQALALHFVRSPRFRRVHDDSVASSLATIRAQIMHDHSPLLAREFVRAFQLEPAGPQALELILDRAIDPWYQLVDSGALFRVSIASMYTRVQATLDAAPLEVWHTKPGCELLISDSPAMTIRYHQRGDRVEAEPNTAIGDAHVVCMPLASDLLVAVGAADKYDVLDEDNVRLFNQLQAQSAHRHLYVRPGSCYSQRAVIEELLL